MTLDVSEHGDEIATGGKTFRVGRSLGRTLYLGDEFFGMCDTREQAAQVVAALNGRTLCEECGMRSGLCPHTNAGYQQAVHRAENFEAQLQRAAGITAGFLTPEAMERWKAHGFVVEDGEPMNTTDRPDGDLESAEGSERLLAEQQARIADLEGEVQRLVQSRSAQHRAEVEALVTQLAEAREQAVEAGQRAEAAEATEAVDPVLRAKYVALAEAAHRYLLSENTFTPPGERTALRRRLVDILMGTGDGA